ncbi:hypothetical protein EV130_111124 [Rhizobium azibense]|uniref:Uncharacterized protein n=1 Tax=Rhizobium azibense TaxID=1136135 RepID=A0A4R3QJX6_9HYPH|nr:hypothetical protein EV130_111124 [Rhizobium azibense]
MGSVRIYRLGSFIDHRLELPQSRIWNNFKDWAAVTPSRDKRGCSRHWQAPNRFRNRRGGLIRSECSILRPHKRNFLEFHAPTSTQKKTAPVNEAVNADVISADHGETEGDTEAEKSPPWGWGGCLRRRKRTYHSTNTSRNYTEVVPDLDAGMRRLGCTGLTLGWRPKRVRPRVR